MKGYFLNPSLPLPPLPHLFPAAYVHALYFSPRADEWSPFLSFPLTPFVLMLSLSLLFLPRHLYHYQSMNSQTTKHMKIAKKKDKESVTDHVCACLFFSLLLRL
jgi:fumarate reductase subunit C